MKFRFRILITPFLLCHLLAVPCVVRAQTPATSGDEEVTVYAVEQEKDGALFTLRGRAQVRYRGWVLYADEITYNSDSNLANAEGHVVLDGGSNDEHIVATHASYNVKTEFGRFENVSGTSGLHLRSARTQLISPNPFAFTGKLVEKNGPGQFIVHNGTVTSCDLPHPKWQFAAGKTVVNVDGNASIYNSVFRVFGVPVLYFPFATHPVERVPRQSGFLVPNFGHSSRKGTVLGEAFYWAPTRNFDTTIGAEYYSARGWAQRGSFRSRPSETSFLDLNFFGVLDRGLQGTNSDQGGQDVHLNAEALLPRNLRGVANIEYLSSYVFRLAFNEVFSQVVNSEVKSTAFLSGSARGIYYNLLAERYQNFQTTNLGDVITILRAPSVQVTGVEQALASTPLRWSFDAAAEGLSRSEPSFRTGSLLGRFDASPRLALPLLWRGWSLRPELALHDTLYTQRLTPSASVGSAADALINRSAVEGSVELRPPALERIFASEVLGRKIKHVIEPRVTYRYVTGINNFADILRFDSRDILSNTHEVEYALVNRVYARRRNQVASEDCGDEGIPTANGLVAGKQSVMRAPWQTEEKRCPKTPPAREIIRWELAQKFFLDPDFGGALMNGRRNVLTATASLTGIAFLTSPRHLSPLISRLKLQTSARSEAEWAFDYDFRSGRINSSSVIVGYHLGRVTVGGSDNYLRVPGEILLSTPLPSPPTFHQFRVLLGYGNPSKRGVSAATNFGFDSNRGFLQYAASQVAYNWDCCGINFEYRRFALGSVRNENQYRFSFNLANVGTFGNLRRQERLF